MASRTCQEYNHQENGEADSQEDAARRRKKNFQCEVFEENPPEENGISNRLFSPTFIPPLTCIGRGRHRTFSVRAGTDNYLQEFHLRYTIRLRQGYRSYGAV